MNNVMFLKLKYFGYIEHFLHMALTNTMAVDTKHYRYPDMKMHEAGKLAGCDQSIPL